eukprot:CAMPEP_0184874626 /NCGR_PEP_ID=MMETSP0580-20130426/42505_1 /TAXON_ID=1118495 /ORGANISM="Dactyliosolen fragilissimus" /LENGTH=1037 /DNA_ID=CAMNT_0027377671 /DNA_START=1768 /DNA_END=4881 /DNA_ORIENTATION=+
MNLLEPRKSDLLADVLSSMATLYCETGHYVKAIEFYEKCLQIRKHFCNEINAEIALIMVNIGVTYIEVKRYTDAKKFLSEALQVLKSKLGNCEHVAFNWYSLARVFIDQLKPREALSCCQSALTIYKDCDKENARIQIGNILHVSGKCLLFLNECSEAITSFKEALEIRLSVYGKDDSDVAQTHKFLADAQCIVKDKKNAILNYHEAITIRMALMGSNSFQHDHIYELLEWINCAIVLVTELDGTNIKYAELKEKKGMCLALLHEYDSAIECHLESMTTFLKLYGPKHITYANALHNIGSCLNEKGEPDKATKYLQKALTFTREKLGYDHTHICDILIQLGVSFNYMSNWSEAQKYFEEALEFCKQISQYESEKSANIMEQIGDMALNEGSINIAENCFQESLRIKKLSREEPNYNLFFKVASIRMKRNEYSKAIENYEECLYIAKSCGEEDTTIANTYFCLGVAHDMDGNYKKALRCHNLSLAFKIKDNFFVLRTLTNKANVLLKLKKMTDAKDIYIKALEVLSLFSDEMDLSKEKADIFLGQGLVHYSTGEDLKALSLYDKARHLYLLSGRRLDKSLAKTLHFMAIIHLRRGDYEQALARAIEAHDIRNELLGNEHEETGDSIYCQGTIYFASKEYEKALSCMKLSIRIHSKSRGKHHITVANAQFFAGCCEDELKNFDQALTFLKDAMAGRKKNLGPNDYNIAKTLHKLGNVHKAKKEFRHGAMCLKECLRILTFTVGPEHLDVAYCLLDLGEIFLTQSQNDEALYSFTEALEIFRKNFKSDHITIARCLSLIGGLYDARGNIHDALKTLQKSENIYQSNLGTSQNKEQLLLLEFDSVSYASVLYSLARIFDRQQDYKVAADYYSKALKIYKIYFGSENLHVADIIELIANMRGREEDFEKAVVLLEESLRIKVDILGPEHKDITSCLFSLGVIFDKRREFDAAIKAYSDCLAIQRASLGPETVEVATTLTNIGACLGNQGEFEDALHAWDEALEIYTARGFGDTDSKITKLSRYTKKCKRLLKKKESMWDVFR